MPLTTTDVWSWKQLVDLSHLVPKQETMIHRADDETLSILDTATTALHRFITNEVHRRKEVDVNG